MQHNLILTLCVGFRDWRKQKRSSSVPPHHLLTYAGVTVLLVGISHCRMPGVMPADRADAVFVPFSTFSVERDGIPNEFPPADSLAALLHAAGVRGERFVIVGDPIPAGRAFSAFDWLGLGDRAALLDGGRSAARHCRRRRNSHDPAPPTIAGCRRACATR